MQCVPLAFADFFLWCSGSGAARAREKTATGSEHRNRHTYAMGCFLIILRVAEISGRKTTVANLHSARDLRAEPMHGNERRKSGAQEQKMN